MNIRFHNNIPVSLARSLDNSSRFIYISVEVKLTAS
jgi:hypothetical protein